MKNALILRKNSVGVSAFYAVAVFTPVTVCLSPMLPSSHESGPGRT